MEHKDFSVEAYIPQKDILDVRILLAINFISSVFLFAASTILTITIFCISFTVMFLFKMKKTALKYTVAFFICQILSGIVPHIFTAEKFHGFIAFIGFICFMIAKTLPLFMIAHVITKKVNSGVLVCALRKLGLHKGFVLALTVALRFIGTARHEIAVIKDCMKMRGIDVTLKRFFKNPQLVIEYLLVPLLFRSLKISDEMTAAALVKGVEYGGKKTSLVDVRITAFDAIFFLVSVLLMVLCFLYGKAFEKMLYENISRLFGFAFSQGVCA